MSRIYDMIILGGGPAGYTAALYAARAGMDVVVLERMSAGGQMALTDVIENYPGFEEGIYGFTLGSKMQKGAERFGAETQYTEVVSVSLSEPIKQVQTTEGTLLSKTVVIATGANPKKLNLPKEKELTGRGVHYCAHCDGRFYQGKTVAVVGGGNSAAADALYLSKLAKKVYLIHRRDQLRATKIYHDPLKKAENVEFIWNSTVSGFLFEDRLQGITVKGPQTETVLSCDAVFISIGRSPATEFLNNQLTLDEYGFIIAGESTKTNLDGVYAVGDVRTKPLRQVVTAVGDGAVAADMAEKYLTENK